jgi:hypothetical protein
VAPPDFLRAALTESNDVRLSSRKAACSSMAPPSSTGNPGSVYINCETALAGTKQLIAPILLPTGIGPVSMNDSNAESGHPADEG